MKSAKSVVADARLPKPSLMCRWPGRVAIENIQPTVDAGCWPTKRVIDEEILIEADVYSDGHDIVECDVLWRVVGDGPWQKTPMRLLANDRWRGSMLPRTIGLH